jgi:hypothetical protein
MKFTTTKQSTEDLELILGQSFIFPNIETGLIEEKIIINPKKEYGFWAKRLLKALNKGLITQFVYDVIKDNENEERQFYTISLNLDLSKEYFLSIIEPFNFEFINKEETTINILKLLNDNGYQVIKNK